MVEISRNLAKIGRTARSLEILRGAEGRAADSHDLRQPEMLAEIAECWVVSGEYSRAKQLAQTIESKVYQISPVVRVASALAAAGRIDDAIELVTLVQYEHNQDAVLMAIAQALALNGEIAGVERIIEGVSSEREKMRARASVAECLTGNASPDARAHARRIVAELLVTDSWHLAIPALAILDQDAVFDIGVAILKFLVV
jgi:hypothetical protein